MQKSLMSGEEKQLKDVIDWLRDDKQVFSASSSLLLLGICSAAV